MRLPQRSTAARRARLSANACVKPPCTRLDPDMFAALLPLVLSLAPQLAGMIFGSKGDAATAKVASVVQSVVGGNIDLTTQEGAAAAVAAIQVNSDASRELQAKLAELHQQMQQEGDRGQDKR